MKVWPALVAVVVVAAITYSMRAGMVLALAGRTVPPAVERMLRHVGPAVLTALAVNLAVDPGTGRPLVGALVGMSAAAGVGLWRRNLLLATAVGMSAVWLVARIG
ncbi:MAG: AzlD domain-containing protein [Ilumatobacteraceae bacterium]